MRAAISRVGDARSSWQCSHSLIMGTDSVAAMRATGKKGKERRVG